MNTIGPDGLLEHEDEFYVGLGNTPRERQADAALQELLDEVDITHLLRLANYLADLTVGWESPRPEYGQDRLKLAQLMLHHGWTPPVLHHEPLPASEQADHGTVQTWALAMRMRRAVGMEGHMTPLEELSWFQLAEQAVKIRNTYTND